VAAGRRDVGARFVMPYYGSGSGLTGRPINRPLGTVTCKDRWALVDGDRMRMLRVEEYRAAMGFPSDYALPATRHDAIRALGNAVPPPLARWAVDQVSRHLAS
jgi:DNA (cytosine-5)-methyltransferase 1